MNFNQQNPETLQTLDDLVSTLSEGERTTFNEIIRTVNLPNHVFKNHCSWSDKSYTRNCLFDNEKFELILLCWEQGQATPIHDHDGEECWVRIIEGEFRETIYKEDKSGKLNVIKSNIATTGDITYMIDFMGFHCLKNLSNKRSMSLHLYAKPIRNCNIFDENSGEFVNKKMSYNTVIQTVKIKK